MPEQVVIIGSGPAGWSAATYTARANLNPLVFEGAVTEENRQDGTLPLGQLALTTEVENFPGWPAGDLSEYLRTALDGEHAYLADMHTKEGCTGPELMHLMRQQAKNMKARIETDDIVEVDFSRRPFRLKASSGEQVESHSVIIATGARANYLGLESEERYKNHGVSACAVCDGALPRFRDKPLVVVGGGDSAVEEADYLSKFASTVYMVHRRDRLRASKIMADRALNNPKIEILWNSEVDEVLGDEQNGLTGVRLRPTTSGEIGVREASSNGSSRPGSSGDGAAAAPPADAATAVATSREVEAAGMFLAIGHTPNTRFLEGKLEMTPKKYVVWTVPFRTNTSVEGVFAAGDVADDYYRQAVTAAGTGCMAALDAERWLAEKGL